MFSKEKLIEVLGLSQLGERDLEDIVSMADKLIYQGVIVKAMGLLGSEDKEAFDELLIKNIEDEEAVMNFLQSKIPSLNEIINEELESFKKESAGIIKKMKERKRN